MIRKGIVRKLTDKIEPIIKEPMAEEPIEEQQSEPAIEDPYIEDEVVFKNGRYYLLLKIGDKVITDSEYFRIENGMFVEEEDGGVYPLDEIISWYEHHL